MRFGHFQKNLPPAKLKMLPHRRSRCTGMIGTSVPSTIFSMPRLKGSMLPVRLMAPSAKMQTMWPGGDLAARGADRFHRVARLAGAHRNRVHAAQQPVEGLHLVVRLPHHEADEALHAGADQEAVDVRHVIRHQQRGPVEGHVFLALDADAEDAVREQPEHEAHEVIGHDGDDVDA